MSDHQNDCYRAQLCTFAEFWMVSTNYLDGSFLRKKNILVLPYPLASIKKALVHFSQITPFLLDLERNRYHQWIPHAVLHLYGSFRRCRKSFFEVLRLFLVKMAPKVGKGKAKFCTFSCFAPYLMKRLQIETWGWFLMILHGL